MELEHGDRYLGAYILAQCPSEGRNWLCINKYNNHEPLMWLAMNPCLTSCADFTRLQRARGLSLTSHSFIPFTFGHYVTCKDAQVFLSMFEHNARGATLHILKCRDSLEKGLILF